MPVTETIQNAFIDGFKSDDNYGRATSCNIDAKGLNFNYLEEK